MFGVKEREIRLDLFLIADPQTKSPRCRRLIRFRKFAVFALEGCVC